MVTVSSVPEWSPTVPGLRLQQSGAGDRFGGNTAWAVACADGGGAVHVAPSGLVSHQSPGNPGKHHGLISAGLQHAVPPGDDHLYQ